MGDEADGLANRLLPDALDVPVLMYVLLEVGCLECGEDSKVLGIYYSQDLGEVKFEDEVRKRIDSGPHTYTVDEQFAAQVARRTSPGVVALWPDSGSGRGRVQLLEGSPPHLSLVSTRSLRRPKG